MSYDFKTKELGRRKLMSINITSNYYNILTDKTNAFQELRHYLHDSGANVPNWNYFAIFYDRNLNPTEINAEVAFEVEEFVEDKNRIFGRYDEGGMFVSGMHSGPYENLPETYEAMKQWMIDKNIRYQNQIREVYIRGPHTFHPQKEYLTEILWSVKK